MGHGPARELSSGDEVLQELSPEGSALLDQALARLDQLDPKFKAARDEERFAQTTKMWTRTCTELDGHLRKLAKVLFASHQLNLDIGSEGGGIKAKPWLEEMSKTFERLSFRLEGNDVLASVGAQGLATVRVKDLTYEWVEGVVVDWIVGAAQSAKPAPRALGRAP